MYSAYLSRIFFFFKIMSPIFFNLGPPVDEQVFFPEISSILFVHCQLSSSVVYSSIFLYLSLIHFSLASSHFLSHLLMQRFKFFSIIFFTFLLFSIRFKISSVIHPCFVFRSTLGICSTAASVIATLNFSHCWSLPQRLLRLQIYFQQPHDTSLQGSDWILIKPSQVCCF